MPASLLSRSLPLLLLAVLPACQSQWYKQSERRELVTTEILVDTKPTGAEISFNGVPQGRAPLLIPVEYLHIEEIWSRQSNHGARMREDMSAVESIVTAPAWGAASAAHYTEDRIRHVYGANEHVLTAYAPGYDEGYQEVSLEGEERVEVVLSLRSSK